MFLFFFTVNKNKIIVQRYPRKIIGIIKTSIKQAHKIKLSQIQFVVYHIGTPTPLQFKMVAGAVPSIIYKMLLKSTTDSIREVVHQRSDISCIYEYNIRVNIN